MTGSVAIGAQDYNTFSYFGAGKKPSEEEESEEFYNGCVPGLLVDNAKNYVVKSNRESGYGRYDVVLRQIFGHSECLRKKSLSTAMPLRERNA